MEAMTTHSASRTRNRQPFGGGLGLRRRGNRCGLCSGDIALDHTAVRAGAGDG